MKKFLLLGLLMVCNGAFASFQIGGLTFPGTPSQDGDIGIATVLESVSFGVLSGSDFGAVEIKTGRVIFPQPLTGPQGTNINSGEGHIQITLVPPGNNVNNCTFFAKDNDPIVIANQPASNNAPIDLPGNSFIVKPGSGTFKSTNGLLCCVGDSAEVDVRQKCRDATSGTRSLIAPFLFQGD